MEMQTQKYVAFDVGTYVWEVNWRVRSLLDGGIVNAIETKNLWQIWSSFSPLWISILDWIISRLVCRETAPKTGADLVAIILGVEDQEGR